MKRKEVKRNIKLSSKLLLAALLLFNLACQKEDDFVRESEGQTVDKFQYPDLKASVQPSSKPMSVNDLLGLRRDVKMRKGVNNLDVAYWDLANDYELWSGILASDSRISIGIKPPNIELKDDDPVLFNDKEQMQYARDYTLNYIISSLRKKNPKSKISKETLKFQKFKNLPIIRLNLNDYEVISKVRQLPSVRYIEPTYDFKGQSKVKSAGCRSDQYLRDQLEHEEVSFDGGSYLIPWQQKAHHIPDAWTISRGKGITVGIIDTGVSDEQPLLGSLFNTYLPSRTMTKTATGGWSDTDDDCSHGTTLAGQIAGPINNKRAIIGIAHQANLFCVIAANNVTINTNKEVSRVVEALELLADSQAKIISISMGRINRRRTLKDAINLAYDHQKLIVAAAGTAVAVYPARYPNVIAATGTRYDPSNPTNLSKAGITNVTGKHVDFAVYLKRTDNDHWALGMNMEGYDVRKAKGSSSAAATVSGIAALVWSAEPYLTRDQVKDILIKASSNKYRDSNFGWGAINAKKAVELAVEYLDKPLSVSISGIDTVNSSGNYTWSANVAHAEGSVSYKWYWNGSLVSTSPTYTRYILTGAGYRFEQLKLEVSSLDENTMVTNYITVVCPGCPL